MITVIRWLVLCRILTLFIRTCSGRRPDTVVVVVVVVEEGRHYMRVEVTVGDGARGARSAHGEEHPAIDPGRVDHHPELADVGVDAQPK